MSSFKIVFAASKMTLGFSEVSGLGTEMKMAAPPVGTASHEIVLRVGKALWSNEAVAFFAAVKAKTLAPAVVTIQQLDPKGAVLREQTLENVQVSKVLNPGTKAIGKEFAIDEMVILYKGVGDSARKGGGSHW